MQLQCWHGVHVPGVSGGSDGVRSAGVNSANVSVLLGNGDGTFTAAVNFSGGGSSPESVAIGDFNGDTQPDLAVAHNSATARQRQRQATARVSSLQAKIISLELNDYTVRRGQRVFADIERLAPGEPWSIVLDGKTLVRGKASSKGTAITSFVVPSIAIRGIRTIRANGAFPDRTDPDRITIS